MKNYGINPDRKQGDRSVVPLILAGGQGTRIRHILKDIPKPMYEVDGCPFIGWVCRFLSRQGFRDAVVSTGYRAESIRDYFSGNPVDSMQVECCQEHKSLGTAGGFWFSASQSRFRPKAWMVLIQLGDWR